MDLLKIIKDTEKIGVIILFVCPENYSEKGRHFSCNDKYFITINDRLTDTEKIQVILHEKAHYLNQDICNSLSLIPTYQHRIENNAETERIINFMSLVNEEYPINEQFNYVHYMEQAQIHQKHETLVKETAKNLYQANIKNDLI